MDSSSDNIVVIQSGRGTPEVHKGVSDDEIAQIASKHSPDIDYRMQSLNRRLATIRDSVVSDPDKVVEYYRVQAAQAEVDRVMTLDLQETGHPDQVKRIDALHDYTSIGSCLLYDNVGFSGSARFVSVTWPNLGWWPYSYNDRASSAVAWGGNVLFEHSWYRGQRLWMFGFPFVTFRDLGEFGFSNRASSYAGF